MGPPFWHEPCPVVCEPTAKSDCAYVQGREVMFYLIRKFGNSLWGVLQTSGKIYPIPEDSISHGANVIPVKRIHNSPDPVCGWSPTCVRDFSPVQGNFGERLLVAFNGCTEDKQKTNQTLFVSF